MRQRRHGFTLIELITVIAIIGILTGLSLPAVQAARESSRRMTCQNHLRQIGIALHSFESTNRRFPAGAETPTKHAWSSRILRQLEQTPLIERLDFDADWDDESNRLAASTKLQVYACPTSWKTYPGFTDYCGISGSWLAERGDGSKNGMLFTVLPGRRSVRHADVLDGLSHTVFVAEGVAVDEPNMGFWASGLNCFSHDDGGINNLQGGRKEIASLHSGGAYALIADGSVQFLTQFMDLEVLAAYCTRAGNESFNHLNP